MKKIAKTLAITVFILTAWLAGGDKAAAQNDTTLTLKVENISSADGTVMIAVGDRTNPMAMVSKMVAAAEGSVECVLHGIPKGSNNIYVFHDANGNYNLDMNDKGIPQEGCYSGTVEIGKKKNKATIGLQYFGTRKTGK